TVAAQTAMSADSRALIDDVLWNGDGTLATLFTEPVAFVDASLAPIYGVARPSSSTPVRTMLDASSRAGILTSPAILAVYSTENQSSPIQRGKFVRERLLCTTLPDPPPTVMAVPPVITPGSSTRERFSQHSTDPACAGCHHLMDPIGFGFENFDAIGRFRSTD